MSDLEQQKFTVGGKIQWLWCNSPLHQSWTVQQQARVILPAVDHAQFVMLEVEGKPVAYCAWAWMNLEAETRYITRPSTLRPEDWTSGDRLWLIDFVSPFHTRFTTRLARVMRKKFPTEVARGYRVKPGEDRARIAEVSGSGLTKSQSQQRRDDLHAQMLASLERSTSSDISAARPD